jgi:hypothetical protein
MATRKKKSQPKMAALGEFHNAHFLMPEMLWRQLKTRADQQGRSITDCVIDGVKLYLKARPK